jgi:hypothetical protein
MTDIAVASRELNTLHDIGNGDDSVDNSLLLTILLTLLL